MTNRIASVARKNLSSQNSTFSAMTLILFMIVLIFESIRGDGRSCPYFGTNSCYYNNPGVCPASTCQPTGPNYTCSLNGVNVAEGYWSLTAPSYWFACTSPATSATMSCLEVQKSCGTTYHYPTGDIFCQTPCTGTWYWSSCAMYGGSPC